MELYKLRNQTLQAEQVARPKWQSLMATHDAVNRRWLDYELDVGKLIDFPLMTDVREPLTVAFLRAKREADGLRPAAAKEMTAPSRLEAYRAAVNGYEVAFAVAEREARRIRDSNSPARNVSGWPRPGNCCGSRKTAQRRRPNGRQPTNGPAVNWTA